jgi:hypothetical protein
MFGSSCSSDPGAPPPFNPCAHVASNDGGLYCGLSRQFGFSGGKSNVVYDCENGKTVGQTICSGNCVVAPPGTNDYCPSTVGSCNGGVVCGTRCAASDYCSLNGLACCNGTCSAGCPC